MPSECEPGVDRGAFSYNDRLHVWDQRSAAIRMEMLEVEANRINIQRPRSVFRLKDPQSRDVFNPAAYERVEVVEHQQPHQRVPPSYRAWLSQLPIQA